MTKMKKKKKKLLPRRQALQLEAWMSIAKMKNPKRKVEPHQQKQLPGPVPAMTMTRTWRAKAMMIAVMTSPLPKDSRETDSRETARKVVARARKVMARAKGSSART